jgi:quinol monooxygenase YgiN
MFDLAVHIKVQDHSKLEYFDFHLTEMAKKCPLEAGCIYYKVHKITEKVDIEKREIKNEFLVVETWESEKAWKQHLQLEAYLTHYKESLLPFLERDVYFLDDLNKGSHAV